MKCFREDVRLKIVKKILREEHDDIMRAIRKQSDTARFSQEFERMHMSYVSELQSIESAPALDDFILEYRGMSLDEWINTLEVVN